MPLMPDKSVQFCDVGSYATGGLNSTEDLDIVFETLTIGGADPQTILIDVPFRNGSLDETDYFGEIAYNDRDISIGFLIPWWCDDQHSIYSNVQKKLNGRRKEVIFSADRDWYYEGRLKVGDFKIENGFFKFEIQLTADPYKYHYSKYEYSINGTKTIQLYNDFIRAIPKITNNKTIIIQCRDNTVTLGSGEHRNLELILLEGLNQYTITASSATNIVIEYRQGRL